VPDAESGGPTPPLTADGVGSPERSAEVTLRRRSTTQGDGWIRVVTIAVLVGAVAASQWIKAAHAHFPSDLPPLFFRWVPRITPLSVVPLAIGVAFVLLLPRIMRLRTVAFLLVVVAFVFSMACGLAIQDGHPRRLSGCCEPGGAAAVLSAPLLRPTDYLVNVRILRHWYGPVKFARAYPWLARPGKGRLSLRAMTHPPGAVLAAWLLNVGVEGNRAGLALLIVAIGAVGVVPTYFLAREGADERTSRTAAVLFATCPIVLLYTATAFDAVFMSVAALAMAFLSAAPRSTWCAVAGGVVMAFAMTLTYGLLVLALIAVGFFALALRRVSLGAAAARLVLVAASCVVALLLLQQFAGIHLLASFATAKRIQDGLAALRLRSWTYWTFAGNVLAFLVASGLGLASLLVVQTVRAWRARRPGLETLLGVAMIVSSAVGLLRGETEHLWMYFVPLLAAAAAPAVRRLQAEATAGMTQASVVQVFAWTNW
jgi:hypothetical protein